MELYFGHYSVQLDTSGGTQVKSHNLLIIAENEAEADVIAMRMALESSPIGEGYRDHLPVIQKINKDELIRFLRNQGDI